MAELCTKISAPPPSGVMKPYPLPGSYQETVPSTPRSASGACVARDPDAARLRAAVALAHLELDDLPLAEQPRPVVADDLGRVHEQVVGLVPEGEEAEPPLGVEPSDSSLGHG